MVSVSEEAPKHAIYDFVKKAHVGAIGFLKDNTSCKILWSQESRPEHHPGAQDLSL